MTRKDYVNIAKVFAALIPVEGTDARAEWAALRNLMATTLKADNPSFSRERFVAACEERD